MVFRSKRWGLLTFVPKDSTRWTDTCRHCPLWVRRDEQSKGDECLAAPCTAEQRHDGLNGYFTINNIPNTRLTK